MASATSECLDDRVYHQGHNVLHLLLPHSAAIHWEFVILQAPPKPTSNYIASIHSEIPKSSFSDGPKSSAFLLCLLNACLNIRQRLQPLAFSHGQGAQLASRIASRTPLLARLWRGTLGFINVQGGHNPCVTGIYNLQILVSHDGFSTSKQCFSWFLHI